MMLTVKIQYIEVTGKNENGKDEYTVLREKICPAKDTGFVTDDYGHKIFMINPINNSADEFMPEKGEFEVSSEFDDAVIYVTNERGNTVSRYDLRTADR